MKKQAYIDLFDRFQRQHLLVIGDVMVDSYLWGQVERISPEAPVPIVAVQKRENRLGGAANVALNLRALGAAATLLTVVGDDMKGREFAAMLNEVGISDAGVVYSHRRVTTTKFRVIGNKVQMLRVDEEVDHPLVKEDMELMLQRFDALMSGAPVDAIIFQDYDKGVITPDFIAHVVKVASSKGIPVAVDPKQRNFMEYKGVSLFKPNLKELREGLKLDQQPQGEALIAATALVQEKLSASILLVTLSEKGVYIRRRAEEGIEEYRVPAHIRNISDVSGAGDTVISLAALCLGCGVDLRELAAISNRAGGLVCEEVGVVPVNREKLLAELMESATD